MDWERQEAEFFEKREAFRRALEEYLRENPGDIYFDEGRDDTLVVGDTRAVCESVGLQLIDMGVVEALNPQEQRIKLFKEFTDAAREAIAAAQKPGTPGNDGPAWEKYNGWSPPDPDGWK